MPTRSLARSPGFAATAILTLALAIGANSAVFSLVNGLLLAPPPYRDPGRLELVSLEARSPREPEPQLMPWSGPKLDVLTRTQRLYTDLAAFGDEEVALTGSASPERIRVEMVTTNYFSLLGLEAGAGRLLRSDDGAHVAVLGARLFRERFGGDRAALGRTIGLNRAPLTIVGVAPDGFRGLTGDADVFVPLAAAPALTYPTALTEPWNLWLEVVGRVGRGEDGSYVGGEIEARITEEAAHDGELVGVMERDRHRALATHRVLEHALEIFAGFSLNVVAELEESQMCSER